MKSKTKRDATGTIPVPHPLLDAVLDELQKRLAEMRRQQCNRQICQCHADLERLFETTKQVEALLNAKERL